MSDMQADSPVSAIQGPGHALAEAREARGLSIDDMAMRLKFAPRQLEALEADRYDQLPGVAIVRGMVRNYARVLDIDAAPLIAELEQRLQAGPTAVRPSDMHIPIREDKKDGRVLLVLSLIVLIAVGAFALDWYVRDRRAGQTVHVPTSVQNPSAAKQLDLAVKPMPVAQSVAPEAVAAEPAPVIPEPVVEAMPEMKEPVASAPVAPA
ncbi:MAG TPA: helix-turn-helix domain-containing protein, partial [Burkholderiales bacterium]